MEERRAEDPALFSAGRDPAAASLGPSAHLGPDAQIINDNGFLKA